MRQTVLVTGSRGFIGLNLVQQLRFRGDFEVIEIQRSTSLAELQRGLECCDVVVHLAGTNRPQSEDAFYRDNFQFTREILERLELSTPKPIIFSSSVQADLNNPYGRSKRAAELLVNEYSTRNQVPVRILRLPNVFGKWSKPHYNSVVATFVHDIIRGVEPPVLEPSRTLELLYIDDLIEALISDIDTRLSSNALHEMPTYRASVQEILVLVSRMHSMRENGEVLDVGRGLTRALYATYVSALDTSSFTYSLSPKIDSRGSFVEMLKTQSAGQISSFVAKPGVTRGSHFHHSKVEKFFVVSGTARFRFRNIVSDERFEVIVNAAAPKIVESIPGWIHDVTNLGNQDLVVIVWANEVFREDRPDTTHGEVND